MQKLFGFTPKHDPDAEREEPSDSGDPATQTQSSHHANQHFTPTPMPMDPHPTSSPPAAGLPAGTGQDIALAAASDVHDARHALLSPPTPHTFTCVLIHEHETTLNAVIMERSAFVYV